MATRPAKRPGVYTAIDFDAITPSDSANFAKGICTAIFVGGAGVVQAVRWDDTVVPFTCPAGCTLQIMAKRVNNTSTDATLMVVLY